MCGMCRDVYVDVCLNTYGHAHVCICLWRPEVDAGSFFFFLYHSSTLLIKTGSQSKSELVDTGKSC